MDQTNKMDKANTSDRTNREHTECRLIGMSQNQNTKRTNHTSKEKQQHNTRQSTMIMDNIVSLNVDQRVMNMSRLLQEAYKHQPLAILIQDPPKELDTWTMAFGRIGYKLSRPTNGTAPGSTYNNIIYSRDSNTPGNNLKHSSKMALGISVRTTKGTEHLAVSIYIRPRTTHFDLKRDLEKLENDLRAFGISRTVLAGDLNATDPDWAPPSEMAPELSGANSTSNQLGSGHYRQIKIARGKLIANYMNRLKLTCMNNPSTADASTSNIDVVYIGNKATRTWKSTDRKDVGTFHKLMTIRTRVESPETSHQSNGTKSHYKLDKLNSNHFIGLRHEFDKLKHNINQLKVSQLKQRANQMTHVLVRGLLEAQEAVCYPRLSSSNGPGARTTTHTRIKLNKLASRIDTIRTKIRSLTLNRQQRRLTTPKPTTLKRKAQLTKRLKANINRLRSEVQRSLLPNDARDGKLDVWTRIRNTKSVLENDGIRLMNIESMEMHHENNCAKMDIETLEQVASEKFGPALNTEDESAEQMEERRSMRQDNTEELGIEILEGETQDALKMLKSRTFMGPEGLKFQTLIKAANFIPDIIHTWCWTCLRAIHTPKACKTTRGVIIPKKVPGKFRIVHIGSPLTALLERIALTRLDYLLESKGQLCNRQFGFSACIDRFDMVARVIELALRNNLLEEGENMGPKQRRYTTVIGFDVKGAFDNVDQDLIRSKIIRCLNPDPLRHWLAEFIQGRTIYLKHGNLKSKARALTKGVPQGSILGPVLWNMTISYLSDMVSLSNNQIELLAYADDLVLIQMEDNAAQLQERVDLLNMHIKGLNLEIEPDKCTITRLRYESGRRNNTDTREQIPDITIDGNAIKKADSITILGVPITKQLRLNLDDCKARIGTQVSAQLLNQLNRLNIIHTNKEWQTLINSYVHSTLASNYMPILAMDKTARLWCDKTTSRTIKRIFDWPMNASDKVTRLITNTHCNTETIISRALETKSARPNNSGYKLIRDLMALNGDINMLRRQLNESSLNLAQQERTNSIPSLSLDEHIRRYPNPTLRLDIDETPFESIEELCDNKGPAWIAIESSRVAMIAETLFRQTMTIKMVRHRESPSAFINLVSAIWELTNTRTSTRTIAFKQGSSLLAALNNRSNRNWRVIQLREKLANNKWSACVYSKALSKEAKTQILAHTRQLTEEQQDRQAVEWAEWPDTNIYEAIYSARISFERECTKLAEINRSTFIRDLAVTTHETWAKLNPSWISGKTMLMLSGLITVNGSLRKGDLNGGDTPPGCDQACIINHEHTSLPWNKHTTLHRAYSCHRFKDVRVKIAILVNRALNDQIIKRSEGATRAGYSLRRPWTKPKAIEITLEDPRLAQTLLRLLTAAAMDTCQDV